MRIKKFNKYELILKTKYKHSGYVAFIFNSLNLFYSGIGSIFSYFFNHNFINYDGNQTLILFISFLISVILIKPTLNLTKTADILYFNKKDNTFIYKTERIIKNTIFKNNFNFIDNVIIKHTGTKTGSKSIYDLYKINFYHQERLYFSFDISIKKNNSLQIDYYNNLVNEINSYLKSN